MTKANQPIIKKQLGHISVAVFAREVSAADGTIFTVRDFVLQKSWRDKENVWQDQSLSLKRTEIMAAIQALEAAFVESFDKRGGEDEGGERRE